jgi:hypothetical protein
VIGLGSKIELWSAERLDGSVINEDDILSQQMEKHLS